MILDFEYIQGKLLVSEIDDAGDIKINYYPWRSPKKFTPCEDHDPDRHPQYTTWDKKPVKLQYTNRPNRFSIYEFLDRLPKEEQNRLHKLTEPKVFFVDIETRILDTGFVDPKDASSEVLTIAIVRNKKIIVLGIKPLSKKETDKIKRDIEKHFEDKKIEITFKYKSFHEYEKPEKKMMEYFFYKMVPKMPVITGWNFLGYDWTFLINRCRRLGIKPEVSSYTEKLQNIFGTDYEVPAHRLVVDYMEIYKKWNTSVKVKESNSLDWVGNKLVGAKKVSYTDEPGINNLQDLYDKNFERYVFYNAVDTLLVEIIHEKTRLMDIMFATTNLSKIRLCDFSYKNLNTTLVATEGFLREDFREKKNIVLCKNDDNQDNDRIAGGWVKIPKQGINEWVACYDFASLYPTTQRMLNIAPETFKGFVMEENPGYANFNNNFIEIKDDDIICGNGAVFAREESVTVNFLESVYSERKKEKKLMFVAERNQKNLEKEVEELEKELENLTI